MAILAPPLLAGGVFMLERFVVTDREQLIMHARQIAQQAQIPSVQAIEQLIDADYRGWGFDRDGAVKLVWTSLETFSVRSVRFTKMYVEVSADRAQMHAGTIVEYSAGQFGDGHTSLIWNVEWIKRLAGWRILSADQPQQGLELF